MKLFCVRCVVGFGCALAINSSAQLITLEPDAYADTTILNQINPQVSLVTAGANNLPIPFNVTASLDNFGYAATGTNVFGHGGGVPFWNTNRRLRMDFATPIAFLAIDFTGGDSQTNDIGRLDAFDSQGALIGSYTSAPKPVATTETLVIGRPFSDISWAVAYLPDDGGSFGRLDNLRFSVVPEPTTIGLALLGAAIWTAMRKKQSQ
jgi:hypothetical protein